MKTRQLTAEDKAAIVETANRLGIKPDDLTAIMYFESAASMDPDKIGGAGNRYQGLIQFGPGERKAYGFKPGMSIAEQVRGPVYNFLSARGLKPGATLAQIYAKVNPGGGKYVAQINALKPQAMALLEGMQQASIPLPRSKPPQTASGGFNVGAGKMPGAGLRYAAAPPDYGDRDQFARRGQQMVNAGPELIGNSGTGGTPQFPPLVAPGGAPPMGVGLPSDRYQSELAALKEQYGLRPGEAGPSGPQAPVDPKEAAFIDTVRQGILSGRYTPGPAAYGIRPEPPASPVNPQPAVPIADSGVGGGGFGTDFAGAILRGGRDAFNWLAGNQPDDTAAASVPPTGWTGRPRIEPYDPGGGTLYPHPVASIPIGPDPTMDATGDNAVLKAMRGVPDSVPASAFPPMTASPIEDMRVPLKNWSGRTEPIDFLGAPPILPMVDEPAVASSGSDQKRMPTGSDFTSRGFDFASPEIGGARPPRASMPPTINDMPGPAPSPIPTGPYGTDSVVKAVLAGDPRATRAGWDKVPDKVWDSLSWGDAAKAALPGGRSALEKRVRGEITDYMTGLPPDLQVDMAANSLFDKRLMDATPPEGRAAAKARAMDILNPFGALPWQEPAEFGAPSMAPMPSVTPASLAPVQVASVSPDISLAPSPVSVAPSVPPTPTKPSGPPLDSYTVPYNAWDHSDQAFMNVDPYNDPRGRLYTPTRQVMANDPFAGVSAGASITPAGGAPNIASMEPADEAYTSVPPVPVIPQAMPDIAAPQSGSILPDAKPDFSPPQGTTGGRWGDFSGRGNQVYGASLPYTQMGTSPWGSPVFNAPYGSTGFSNSPWTPSGPGWQSPSFNSISGGPTYAYNKDTRQFITSDGRVMSY